MIRFDTTPWLPGAVLFGNAGFGVRGDQIASSGTAGPGYAYNDLSLPADAAKEICGRITTWPTAGTLDAGEDTGFTFTAPDGSYFFNYQLYVDGVATGTPTRVDLAPGSGGGTGPVDVTATGDIAPISLSAPTGTATGGAVIDVSASGDIAPINLSAPTGSASTYDGSYMPSALYARVPAPLDGRDSVAVVGKFIKQPADVQDYDIYFDDWVAAFDDALASATAQAEDGVTLDSSLLFQNIVKLWMSAGDNGLRPKVTITASTAGGRTKQVEVVFKIKET